MTPRVGSTQKVEELRTPADITTPDLRNLYFGKDLDGHHEAINRIRLAPPVPKDIQVQFDVARNLYLYAWYVFRFYPVAMHQASVCLEFALRERIGNEMVRQGTVRNKQDLGLKKLLEFAIESGSLRNEGFHVWQRAVEMRTKGRIDKETFEEMRRLGLSAMEIDESRYVPNEQDKAYDYLGVLSKTIPAIRNTLAHGGTHLLHQVLGHIELVAEIINQIYTPEPGE